MVATGLVRGQTHKSAIGVGRGKRARQAWHTVRAAGEAGEAPAPSHSHNGGSSCTQGSWTPLMRSCAEEGWPRGEAAPAGAPTSCAGANEADTPMECAYGSESLEGDDVAVQRCSTEGKLRCAEETQHHRVPDAAGDGRTPADGMAAPVRGLGGNEAGMPTALGEVGGPQESDVVVVPRCNTENVSPRVAAALCREGPGGSGLERTSEGDVVVVLRGHGAVEAAHVGADTAGVPVPLAETAAGSLLAGGGDAAPGVATTAGAADRVSEATSTGAPAHHQREAATGATTTSLSWHNGSGRG